jgi:hypothetical protein
MLVVKLHHLRLGQQLDLCSIALGYQ